LEFGDKLAEGGAAVVYAGSYKFNDIAIKKVKHLSKGAKAHSSEDEVMLKEAELMRTLKHPNIIRFIALSLHEGQVCLVMDLMVNGSFRDVLDK
jgi:serine/threonine protein kinase